MPSFFNRRYAREARDISAREIALGIAILLAAASVCIVFAMAWLQTDSTAAASPEPSHAAIAEPAALTMLLPAQPHPRWKAETPATGASDSSELPFARPATASQRSYTLTGDANPTVAASIVDMDTAMGALQTCLFRRPSNASDCPWGHDCWRTNDGLVGFWRGRYFTEIDASSAAEEVFKEVGELAAALAELQLDVGYPPRILTTLRNLGAESTTLRWRSDAGMGVPGLVFAAECAGDATVWFAVHPDAQAAHARREAILDELQSSSADANTEPGAAGNSVQNVGPIALVTGAGPATGVFAADNIVGGITGSDREAVAAQATTWFEALTAADRSNASTVANAGTADDDTASGVNGLPAPPGDSWRPADGIQTFSPDRLYVKIDGRADLYLQYGVASLVFARYAHQSDENRAIDLYWYDMGSKENALGIYQAEAPPQPVPVDLDVPAAYVADGAVFFRKAEAYVQVLPTRFDGADDEAVLTLARSMAAAIADEQGNEADPSQLFPAEGRVADSLAYVPNDAFSLEFLDGVHTAEFEVDGAALTAFVMETESAAATEALLQQYQEALAAFGKVIATPTANSASGQVGPESGEVQDPWLIVDVAGYIDVVFAVNNRLAGVSGADDLQAAKTLAERMRSHLLNEANE